MNKITKRWKKFLKEPEILEMKSAMTKRFTRGVQQDACSAEEIIGSQTDD